MEEAKAAAYYDELTRKGSGAARFKQGLGFSSTDDNNAPWKPSSTSSSSFYSNFVRATGTGEQSSEPAGKQKQQVSIRAIQDKLKKKSRSPSPSRYDHGGHSRRRSGSGECDLLRGRDRQERGSRDRQRSRSRERTHSNSRDRKRRSCSRETGRGGDGREDYRKRRRSRSRSGSYEAEERRRRHMSSDDGDRDHTRHRSRRSRSIDRSPETGSRRCGEWRREKEGSRSVGSSMNKNCPVDYSRMIRGYDQMSSAEKVKAKMKLQLSHAADKDMTMGTNIKWERFDFNNEAPLDDEEEIEAAEDDAVLVKGMGQSFRYSAVEAKREDEIKAAHDQSIFGVPVALPVSPEASPAQEDEGTHSNGKNKDALIGDILASTMQQGSWRDRIRRIQDASKR